MTVDGKAYSLPNRNGTYVGVLYSKRLIRKAGLDPMRVSSLIVTHRHVDHLYGLPSLAHNMGLAGRRATLHVYALPETMQDGVFEPSIEVQLLRILQEALTNVRKHARADCVRIVFAFENHRASVTVQDNGQGFDPGVWSEDSGKHVGLRVMRERAEEVGGSLSLHSIPGQGTEVVVEVPVTSER